MAGVSRIYSANTVEELERQVREFENEAKSYGWGILVGWDDYTTDELENLRSGDGEYRAFVRAHT